MIFANTSNSLMHAHCAVDGVAATFASICGEEPTHEESSHDAVEDQAISGIISIVGDIAWSLVLTFPLDTAVSTAMRFAGFEIPYDSADMADVVGELANVVAGDVVYRLQCEGITAELSIPTVARGRNVEIVSPSSQPAHVVRFAGVDGQFWLAVAAARLETSRL
jgi:chemotaxis protein CheX